MARSHHRPRPLLRCSLVYILDTDAETKALEEAKQQADHLRAFLSKAIGERVKVGAILTFPGWMVSSRVRAEIKVLNPKNIRSAVQDNHYRHCQSS